MAEYKCPFSMLQASGSCACQNAQEVIRRGGSEYDCKDPRSHGLCLALVTHLNARALPALGHQDDLTLTPKSVYERVLLGGLQGLRQTHNPADKAVETPDIWTVVEQAQKEYSGMEAIPDSVFIPAVEACTIRRRQRKRH